MHRLVLSAALLAVGLPAGLAQTHSQTHSLVSPWDGSTPVLSGVPYPCPAPPKTQFEPSFDRGVNLVPLATQLTDAADAYRENGSKAAAECTIRILNAAAAYDWMSESDATKELYFQESQALNAAAIAYLKIWGSGVVTPNQAELVQQWFSVEARRQQVFFDLFAKRNSKLPTGHDHRLFLAGYAVMSAAIAADDRRLYDWGVSTFHEGTNKIDKNGMMVWERCSNGLTAKCHLEAAASLVMMAEYGAYNGDALYEYKDGALHLLVKSALAGLADPNAFQAFSDGEAQHLPAHMQPWEIGWAETYQRRFPEDEIARLLKVRSSHRFIGWGGTPAP